ncbi:hypothetical protein BTV66_00165 [Pasteurella multocida subsp. septica]|nr:hypothetical protein BTV67_03900 [Pasteurella multocida subsp. multocida]ARA88134.1 hypothetical protein BTV66_00165 [Pasteurella multocida subsp. septica]
MMATCFSYANKVATHRLSGFLISRTFFNGKYLVSALFRKIIFLKIIVPFRQLTRRFDKDIEQ